MKILKGLLMIITAPIILLLTLFVWLCTGLILSLIHIFFRVPGQLEQDGSPHYVTADEYLSGNVRRKLRQAQRAAQQDQMCIRDSN